MIGGTARPDGVATHPTWEPGIGDHLRTIWRYKWFLIGGAIVIAEIVFVLLSSLVTPRYEADASLRLSIGSSDGPVLEEGQVEFASRVYAELAESPRVLAEAVDNSGLSLTIREAERAFTVEWARPPGFIDVTASALAPEDAAKLADGMAEALITVVDADNDRFADSDAASTVTGSRNTVTAEIVEPAVEPDAPTSPRPRRDAVAVFVIALVVLAEGVALWRPARGLLPLSRTAERVTELVGIPCITLTGDPEDRTRLSLFASRHLSPNLAALVVHCNGRPLPAASVRLAEAATAGGWRTLVIDGECSEPNMHLRLGLPQGPGLEEVVGGTRSLNESVFESQAKSTVSLLTAGGSDGKRQPLAVDEALERLGSGYDLVIVYVGSTELLDGVAGAVAERRKSTILVIDPERTRRRQLSELVHGFGGHEDVVAILLLTKRAAKAETARLAARRWSRSNDNGAGPSPEVRKLNPLRSGRQR